MAKTKTRDRMNNEINAGSMADIAFLLLIFFLVTTTIAEDKGILVALPPWSDEEPDITKLKERNVFSVLVNAQNQLLVREQPTRIGELRERAKEFITNPAPPSRPRGRTTERHHLVEERPGYRLRNLPQCLQ